MRKRLLATLTFDQTMFGPPSGQNMTERARAMLPEQVDAVLGQIRTLPEPSFALDTSSAGYRAFESLGGFGDAPVGTRRAYKENGFIHVKKRLGFDSSTFIGDKLHISVDRTQLEQAYDACAPLLLSKDSPVDYFKIRDRLYAEGRSGRTMDDLQFTLYFKPAGADKTYTAEQIKSVRAFTAQLEDRLKQAGIRPTNIDQSDVKLASSDYISYRHEFNSERETAADFARVSREPFFRLITENPSAGNRELASRTGLNV